MALPARVLLALFASAAAVALAVGAKPAPCVIGWKKPTLVKTYTIKVGESCSWKFTDSLAHCVTFKKPNPMDLGGGKQYQQLGKVVSQRFTKPGLYKVNCCVHLTFMKSIINVVPVKRGRSALEAPKVCKSSCNGKCYGQNGCGGTCPLPQRRTSASCTACCSMGRPGSAPGVAKCVQQCLKEQQPTVASN